MQPITHVRRLDDFETDMIEFVLSWRPYDGPHDEDTFPRFGLSAQQLHNRLIGLLDRCDQSRAPLPAEDYSRLIRLAAALKWTRATSSPHHPSAQSCTGTTFAAYGTAAN